MLLHVTAELEDRPRICGESPIRIRRTGIADGGQASTTPATWRISDGPVSWFTRPEVSVNNRVREIIVALALARMGHWWAEPASAHQKTTIPEKSC